MACSRSRSSWPSRACAGASAGRGRIAEHAHDLVPERGGRELEAVVVARAPHEQEVLVDARERRREQEAVALLLARAIAREAGRRQRAPQLGRAGGLGRLAARQHARLQAAQDDRAHGREPGQADADDADATPRQPVARRTWTASSAARTSSPPAPGSAADSSSAAAEAAASARRAAMPVRVSAAAARSP